MAAAVLSSLETETCPSTNEILQRMDDAYLDLDAYFCGSSCPCDIAHIGAFPLSASTTMKWKIGGANSILECPDIAEAFKEQQVLIDQVSPLLEEAERDLGCSGICTPGDKYLFNGLSQ